MNTTALRWIGLALALVAAYFSNGLLGMHAVGSSDSGILAKICGEKAIECNKVVNSRWGVFPPGPAEVEDGKTEGATEGSKTEESAPRPDPERKGIPVAALGLFYYIFIAVYLGLIGWPSWPVRKLHNVVLGVNALGILGSLIFLSIMLFAIGHLCTLCLITHVCNFLLFPVLWKIRPEEPKFPEEAGGLSKPVLPFPDKKLAATSLLLVFALCYGQWNAYQAKIGDLKQEEAKTIGQSVAGVSADLEAYAKLREDHAKLVAQVTELSNRNLDNAEVQKELERLRGIADDVEKLDAVWLSQEKRELGIRDDDARIDVKRDARGRTGRKMQLTVFADLECPNCGKFYDFLRADLLPLFNGHLEVVYKHYPNRSEHPHALPCAKALEAARLQGGDEKFWELYDYLHERKANLGAVDFTQAALAVGLDPTQFLAEMEAPTTLKRIQADMNFAFKAGVKGTPAVFLNGRMVDRLFRRNVGWWKIRADVLKRARLQSKQEW